MFFQGKQTMKTLIPLVLMLVTRIGLAADEKEMMERFGRLEMGQEMLGKRIEVTEATLNRRIDDVHFEIKDVRSALKDVRSDIKDFRSEFIRFMLWVMGIIFAGIFTLIGFVLWDRRTALSPAMHNMELAG